MRQSKQQQRDEQLARLVEALNFYREHPPRLSTRPAMRAIANRFAVHPKSFEQAIKMMVEEEG